ncbi:hypothetical protein GCM10022215_30730 [Nocardioides fonticola]|uniref:Uncharacterized protein n=1 Tax=Nocardioides fonticola TaxID=450363 RepID=A0ABP7XQH5_9ACTN
MRKLVRDEFLDGVFIDRDAYRGWPEVRHLGLTAGPFREHGLDAIGVLSHQHPTVARSETRVAKSEGSRTSREGAARHPGRRTIGRCDGVPPPRPAPDGHQPRPLAATGADVVLVLLDRQEPVDTVTAVGLSEPS